MFSNGTSSAVEEFHTSFWDIQNSKLNSSADVYDWLRDHLVSPSLGSSSDMSDLLSVTASGASVSFVANNFSVPQNPHVIAGTDMLLVGTIRLRQLRVTQGTCDTSKNQYAHIAQFCQGDYDFGSTDDTQNYFSATTPWYITPGFIHQGSIPTVELTSSTTGITYPPNGYVIDLPSLPGQAVQTVNDLQEYDWIDHRTSAVIAEINTYHSSTNTFVTDQFLFEFTSVGFSVIPSHISRSISANLVSLDLTNNSGLTQFLLDLINLLFYALFVIYFGTLFVKIFARLFSFFFFYIDCTIIVCFSLLIAWRIRLYSMMISQVIEPYEYQGLTFPNPQVFWPISRLNDYMDWIVSIQSILIILMLIRGAKFFYLASGKTAAPMIRDVLVNNFKHIIGVCVIFALVGFGFSFSNYVLLGHVDSRYSSIGLSICATSSWFLGIIPVVSKWITVPSLGVLPFSILCFIFLVYIVLVPVLIGIAVAGTMQYWTTLGNLSQEEQEEEEQNPITVYVEDLLGVKSRDIKKIEEDYETGIDIQMLPASVRKRIYDRRRAVRRKVELCTGYMNPAFDEFNDFVTRYELKLLLRSDSYVGRILRSSDADEAIQRFSVGDANDKQHPSNLIMIPEIDEISQNLTSTIDETSHRLHNRLEQIVKSVSVIYDAAKRINERVKTTKRH